MYNIDSKNKYQKNKNITYFCTIIIFIFMLALRDLRIINIPSIIFLGYVSILFLFFNLSQSLSLIFMLCVIGSGMQYLYAIIIGLIIFSFKNYEKIKIKTFAIIPVLIVLWELFHVLIFETSLSEYLRWIPGFLMIALVICLQKDEINYKLIIKSFSFMVLSSCIIIFLVALKEWKYDFVGLLNSGYRLGRVSEYSDIKYKVTGNSNSLGIFCNISIASEILMILYGNIHKKQKIFSIVRCIGLAMLGTLTLSITFIIVFCVLMVLIVFISKMQFKKKICFVIGIFFVIMLCIFLLNCISPMILQNFLERFAVDDITNGRSYILTFYWDIFISNLDWGLFGIGNQNILSIIASRGYNIESVPHNGIIEMLLNFGILGSLLIVIMFIGFLITLTKYYKTKNKKIDFMFYIPIVLSILSAQAGQYFSNVSCVIILSWTVLIMYFGSSLNKNI